MGLEHFGIETDDLDGAISTFASKGVKVLEEIRSLPNGMRIAFIEAPDNVRLELMQLP
jgi:predicted enzyme related to lactoylglutathione lyase